MNSKQRRISKRHFPYSVNISEDTSLERYLEIRDWCKLHFGEIGYKWGNKFYYLGFYFRKDSDAVLFTLKCV